MSGHMQELISQYGYWLMLVAALIEGETFLIAGGIAAHHGLLNVYGVIALAIIGSLVHDHIFFYIGRFTKFEALLWRYSKKLSTYRKFKKKINKGLKLFHKYGVVLIIGFRFMYGLRTIVPIIIGLSPVSKLRFFLLDLVGATIWALAFVYGGYYAGSAIKDLLENIHTKYHVSWLVIIIFGILTIILIMGAIWFLKRLYHKVVDKNTSLQSNDQEQLSPKKHIQKKHIQKNTSKK